MNTAKLEKLLEPYDFLVCLALETTHDSQAFNLNYRRIYIKDQDKNDVVHDIKKKEDHEMDFESASLIPNTEDMTANPNFP